MAKKIGVVGSRRRHSNNDKINLERAFFAVYEPGDIIVSGGCWCGGDKFAEEIARDHAIPIIIHKAKWDEHGRRVAGFIRNTLIAEEVDMLIALVARDRTGGTEDTIRKAEKLSKEIVVIE